MDTTPLSSLTVRRTLACAPDFAFRAWTTPDMFRRWFTPGGCRVTLAEFDVRPGGKYRLGFDAGENGASVYVGGEFLVVDPPRRIEYTWIWEKESKPEWTDRTVVAVEFLPLDGNRTEIVLTHDRFTDEEERQSHTEGWTSIVESMAASVAGDKS